MKYINRYKDVDYTIIVCVAISILFLLFNAYRQAVREYVFLENAAITKETNERWKLYIKNLDSKNRAQD